MAPSPRLVAARRDRLEDGHLAGDIKIVVSVAETAVDHRP
jgi:hypothetical protein